MDVPEPIIAGSNHLSLRIAGDLVSMSGLRGRFVFDRTGRHVGRLADLVVHRDNDDPHPPISGALVRAGIKLHYIPEAAIVGIRHWNLYLCTVGLTPRTIPTDDQLVKLARDVLLSTSTQVSDVILACSIDAIRLVGIDTTLRTLLRRLVPTRFRRRVYPHRLDPWRSLRGSSHSKPSDATLAPPRRTSTPPQRSSQPAGTPPYTPYTRRRRTHARPPATDRT